MSETQLNAVRKAQLSMRVDGMTCASCVSTIEKALLSEDGVISAAVSLLDEKAVVEYQPDKTDRLRLEKAVDSTGYRAARAKMMITLTPIPEEDQWDLISEQVGEVNGIITVTPFKDRGRLLLEYDESLVTYKIVKRSLRELGFEASDTEAAGVDRESSTREKEIRYYSRLLIFSLALSIPVLLLTLVPEVLYFFSYQPVLLQKYSILS